VPVGISTMPFVLISALLPEQTCLRDIAAPLLVDGSL
jgi:hypothetical protein